MTRKRKYVFPEPKYKDVCIPNNNFKSREDWVLAIYSSQSEWPEWVGTTYQYESHSSPKNDEEFNRIITFLEAGVNQGALAYRRYHVGFSFRAVVDEYTYAKVCNQMGVAKDFVLIERNPRVFELVCRETPPVTEASAIPTI